MTAFLGGDKNTYLTRLFGNLHKIMYPNEFGWDFFLFAEVMFCFLLLYIRIIWGTFENENPRCTEQESLGVGPRNHMQVHLKE